MTTPHELGVKLVRTMDDVHRSRVQTLKQAFGVGLVAAVDAGFAAVRKGDEATPATGGFQIPPQLLLRVGDLVWYFDLAGFRIVVACLNRDATRYPSKPVFDPVDYGAQLDGRNDDTQAFADAIGYANENVLTKDPQLGNDEYVFGGEVRWQGLAYVRQILPLSNVTLAGYGSHASRSAVDQGAYISRLKQIDGSNVPLIFVGLDVIGTGFRDFCIDGNKAHQSGSSHYGIQLEDVAPASWSAHAHVPRTPIERVLVQNFLVNGIDVGAPHLAVQIKSSFVNGCDQDGIRIGASDYRIDLCEIGGSGRYGINVEVGAGHISQTDIYHCERAISVDAGSMGYSAPVQLMVDSCLLGPQDRENVYIGANVRHTSWDNTTFRNASQESPGTYSHVKSDSIYSEHTFNGSMFLDNDGGGPNVNYDYEVNGAGSIIDLSTHSGQYQTALTNAPTKVLVPLGGGTVADASGALKLTGSSTIRSGSGAPAAGLGINGDFYFRTDTPGTANQRLYIKSAGAYVGII